MGKLLKDTDNHIYRCVVTKFVHHYYNVSMLTLGFVDLTEAFDFNCWKTRVEVWRIPLLGGKVM